MEQQDGHNGRSETGGIQRAHHACHWQGSPFALIRAKPVKLFMDSGLFARWIETLKKVLHQREILHEESVTQARLPELTMR